MTSPATTRPRLGTWRTVVFHVSDSPTSMAWRAWPSTSKWPSGGNAVRSDGTLDWSGIWPLGNREPQLVAKVAGSSVSSM